MAGSGTNSKSKNIILVIRKRGAKIRSLFFCEIFKIGVYYK